MGVLFTVLTLAVAAASSWFLILRDFTFPSPSPSPSPVIRFSSANVPNFLEHLYSATDVGFCTVSELFHSCNSVLHRYFPIFSEYLYHLTNITINNIDKLYDSYLSYYSPLFSEYLHYLKNVTFDNTSKLYNYYLDYP